MKIKDEAAWKKWVESNQDFYGKGIIDYAERWADLIEEELNNGKKLEDVAKETSHRADTDGITGFMYGAAVQVLYTSWEYGDQLRRWHNLDCQIHNEGEEANEKGAVLNPAVLSING
jgi:hypothetical protein